MTQFLLYIARVGLYMSLLYSFYLLIMRRTTFFRLNRMLLLGGSYLCLLLPFIKIRSATTLSIAVSDLVIVASREMSEVSEVLYNPLTYSELLLILYLIGAVVTISLFIISAWRMERLICEGEEFYQDGNHLILLDKNIPSFSWGDKIVMNRKDLEKYPIIFTHEQMHVQYRHSLDLLILLPIRVLFWWNPLVWIIHEEVRLLHEYEADKGVIQKGIDANIYQLLIVRKAVGEQHFSLASGFKHAKLKNRIKMMLKSNSSGWVRWAYLALIPIFVAFMFACNQNKVQNVSDEEVQSEEVQSDEVQSDEIQSNKVPYPEVEVKPTFNGGNANDEFVKWFYSHVQYPEQAIKDDVQGRVTLQFTIDTDGSVKDIEVVRGECEELNKAAVDALSASPKWTPGRNAEGRVVPVHFVLPVVFKLQ